MVPFVNDITLIDSAEDFAFLVGDPKSPYYSHPTDIEEIEDMYGGLVSRRDGKIRSSKNLLRRPPDFLIPESILKLRQQYPSLVKNLSEPRPDNRHRRALRSAHVRLRRYHLV